MSHQADDVAPQDLAREAREWIDCVSAPEATRADTDAMLLWRARSPDHAEALRDAVRLHRRMRGARDAMRSEPAFAHLLQVAPPAKKPVLARRAFLGGALAASVGGVLLVRPPLGLWPSFAELRADYRTAPGEQRTLQLAQGLSVELNTRTSVARRQDSAAHRLALISGEVAVDAARPGMPAVIETAAAEARSGEGRFSVRLADSGTCVTCFAGTVEVADRRTGRLQLDSGQQVVVGDAGLGAVAAVDTRQVEAWRRGELVFTDRPLGEVVEEINRYRSGRIILTNAALGRIPVNAVFRLGAMDRALAQIQAVSRASARHLPGGIVLLG
ncbi:FecR domain-containing protein [Sphingomonas sp. KR3-1]|uniref:FecR family protein n=1 Tax=Sphingomonas sp. KR3-1 TaxID=3156611 RepID=UPI0032B517C6